MEISDVKKRVLETIDKSKRRASDRRARVDEAARDYEQFLNQVAVPLVRQVHNVLRALGLAFTVFTPGGSVRLMSDRSAQDFIEITLDTADDEPMVMGHASRSRGRRVVESERPLGPPATISEEDVLSFVMKELEPYLEK